MINIEIINFPKKDNRNPLKGKKIANEYNDARNAPNIILLKEPSLLDIILARYRIKRLIMKFSKTKISNTIYNFPTPFYILVFIIIKVSSEICRNTKKIKNVS